MMQIPSWHDTQQNLQNKYRGSSVPWDSEEKSHQPQTFLKYKICKYKYFMI